MERVSVLLKPETIKEIDKEAKEKSISRSAVIRQRVEAQKVVFTIDPNNLFGVLKRGK